MIFSTRRVEVSGHREGVLTYKSLSVAKLQNRGSTSFCLLLPTRRLLTWTRNSETVTIRIKLDAAG